MSLDSIKLPNSDLAENLARAWRDGYRAAKTGDKDDIPGFLMDPEDDFGDRADRYARASIQHYGIQQPEDTARAWAAWLRLVMPRYKDCPEGHPFYAQTEAYNEAIDNCFEALSKEKPPFGVSVHEPKQAFDAADLCKCGCIRGAHGVCGSCGKCSGFDAMCTCQFPNLSAENKSHDTGCPVGRNG